MNQYYIEHSKGAYALAAQMLGCQQDAQDVVQDSLHTILKHSAVPTESGQFKAWFYTIVRNKVIDRLRTRKRRPTVDAEEASLTAAECNEPEASLHQKQVQLQIQQALSELSEAQREIILLKDWQGFSYADIARILGVENGTVMSRLHRARMALREKLAMLSDHKTLKG
nr:sigma-70 family RNA polymerase sigma factor [Pleionea sp. CnH1-48]